MKYDLSRTPTRGASRTLAAFADAMLSLVAAGPFERVSVSSLCERAGYPRATFYNYFDDKYDLLDYCWRRIADEIRFDEHGSVEPGERLFVYFDRICDVFDAHRSQIDATLASNPERSYLLESLRRYVASRIHDVLDERMRGEGHGPVPSDVMAEHYADTLMLVLEHIYLRSEGCSRDEARAWLRYLVGGL